MSVLIGNGDGTFQQAVNYGVGTGVSPTKLVGSLDFNGDGSCDLAVTNGFGGTNNNGNIAILLGNGDGTFGPAVNYETDGVQPDGIAAADFNGDLSQDLVVTNAGSANVTVFFNDGNGTFVLGNVYPVGISPTSVTIYQDTNLVVVNLSSNRISLLHGTNGQFKLLRNYPTASGSPVTAVQGFLNADSTPDAVVADNNGQVTILPGRPDRLGFRYPQAFPTCSQPNGIAAFDFNHDNRTDLAVVCSDGVGIMLNMGP